MHYTIEHIHIHKFDGETSAALSKIVHLFTALTNEVKSMSEKTTELLADLADLQKQVEGVTSLLDSLSTALSAAKADPTDQANVQTAIDLVTTMKTTLAGAVAKDTPPAAAVAPASASAPVDSAPVAPAPATAAAPTQTAGLDGSIDPPKPAN